jgi:cell division protein FtsW
VRNKNTKLLKQKKVIDRRLFYLIAAFVVIGLIAVADVSAPEALNSFGDKFYLLKQQLIGALVGTAALLIASKIPYLFWQKIATPLFFASVLLLLAVLVPNLGLSAMGARRWISIGPVNFQPSEIVKFTLCLYLAKVASKNKSTLSYLLPILLVCVLIMLQPDLGTTLIIASIGFSQVLVSGVNLLHIFGAAFGAIALGIPLILFSDYRKARLLSFFDMEKDPLSASYHIKQILLALGSGGIFGVGLGASKQKFLFLPEAANDSIFAVLAEELGFLGATVIILMFFYLVAKAFSIAKTAPDIFSKVLAVGIGSWIGIQAVLNIGSMVAIVPLTGVPLPFISYGGSSLVMILTACGILLNISKHAAYEHK